MIAERHAGKAQGADVDLLVQPAISGGNGGAEPARTSKHLDQPPAFGLYVAALLMEFMRMRFHQSESASKWPRWLSSKKGQAMKLVSAISIPLEDRLLLGDERVVGAHEILRLHADCLRLGFCFDRSLDRHRPFHLELILGHAVREGRTVRQIGGKIGRAHV